MARFAEVPDLPLGVGERQREQMEATTQEVAEVAPRRAELARRGHYSAAVADGKNIFIVKEYISGVDRDTFVNWATSMSEIITPK
ncbi:MAG: hypothetical protein WBY69_18205 [Candidatus Acidiferrales bacterium]